LKPVVLYILAVGLALGVIVVTIMAFAAPYVYAEYEFDLRGDKPTILPMPTTPVEGRWFEEYFLVQSIGQDTYAIGEPRYYQGNYSYLIIGSKRAILFDSGSGLKDIAPVVRSLTKLPVTILPSHLHFDHVGGLGHLDKIALVDDPALRSRIKNSELTLDRYELLGFADRLPTKIFRVDEWWPADTTIDLGGRSVLLLRTPGHTPTSISLYEKDRGLLFSGDFIYPNWLYAFLPGASRSQYLATTKLLLSTVRPETKILAAHMQGPPAVITAPVLKIADLVDLQASLNAIESGHSKASGFYPRVYLVNDRIQFATGWSWNNR
jgi:hydroxyacylglutathione hydrolase